MSDLDEVGMLGTVARGAGCMIGIALGCLSTTLPASARPMLTLDCPSANWSSERRTVALTEEQIMVMPTVDITTKTRWLPTSIFTGPTLARILAMCGIESGSFHRYKLKMTAINEYTVSIPGADIDKYSPILAYEIDGKRLTKREYGPLWLMYPRDAFPELYSNATEDDKLIWQLARIRVDVLPGTPGQNQRP